MSAEMVADQKAPVAAFPATPLPVQPETGSTAAHAGHTAPAKGGTGRGEPSVKGDGNAACTEDPQQNATAPGLAPRMPVA